MKARAEVVRTRHIQTRCLICESKPATETIRDTRGQYVERALHHCKDCGEYVGCSDDLWPSPAIVRGVLGVVEAIRLAPLEKVRLSGPGRERRATAVLLASLWKRTQDGGRISILYRRAPRLRTGFGQSTSRPDAAVNGWPSSALIAVEIKVLSDDANQSAEIDRGIGQCVKYGLGFSDTDRYGAAILVAIRSVCAKPRTHTRLISVLEVRPRWDEPFWVYHVVRDVMPPVG